jgi:uncharacterized membrane protein YbhN (UPF0104 family)
VTSPPRWVSVLLAACGVAILGVLAATLNVGQLASALRDVQPALLGVAAAAVALQVMVKALRWRYMIGQLTGTRISLGFAALSVVAGVAAGSLTPGRSFEMGKALLLKGTQGISLAVSTSAMIVERVLDLVLLVGTLLVAALFLSHQPLPGSRALATVAGVFMTGVALAGVAPLWIRGWARTVVGGMPVSGSVRTRLVGLVDTLCESFFLWRTRGTLGALLGLTALSAALEVARVWAVFWGMGAHLPVALLAFSYGGAAILGMVFLIPGGIGVTEVSQVGLLDVLTSGAVASVVVRSAVLVDRVLSYYLLMLGGAVVLIGYARARRTAR